MWQITQLTMCEICSKFNSKDTRTTSIICVFIVDFKQISHIALVFPLLTLNKKMPPGKVFFIFVIQFMSDMSPL